jgi:transposase InsO family protein
MNANMTAQLVADALLMAVWRRAKPDTPMHHPDRGSQYASGQFQRLMADSGIVRGMSRSGNVWDNAAVESLFSSLKTERTGREAYRTRNEVRADVSDQVERFTSIGPTTYSRWRQDSRPVFPKTQSLEARPIAQGETTFPRRCRRLPRSTAGASRSCTIACDCFGLG